MTIQRDIPDTIRNALEQEHTSDFPLIFLTITHPELIDAIRVVNDAADFMLSGNLYRGYEFEIKLLTDDDEPPKANLRIQNIDRAISQALMKTVNPAMVSIQLIAASEFNLTVDPRTELGSTEYIYNAQQLYLTDVTGDALWIEGTLRSWDYTQETWPAIRATEARFPGLYW